MSEFPTLEELGIDNPNEIDRYSLQTINDVDILRVVYRRQKGSLLTESKKISIWPRREITAHGRPPPGRLFTMKFRHLCANSWQSLDQIVHAKHDKNRKLEILEEELHRLEEESAHRIAYIRNLIAEL